MKRLLPLLLFAFGCGPLHNYKMAGDPPTGDVTHAIEPGARVVVPKSEVNSYTTLPPYTLVSGEHRADAASTSAHCGQERWLPKTSADKDAGKVNFTPAATTIAELNTLKAPTRAEIMAHSDSRFPEELKTYMVTGYLVGFKLEADEDFHIVIQDLNTPDTMVVEMPNADCVPENIKTYSANLQASFQTRFGKATPRFKKIPGKVKITVIGIGFYDFLHGQTGVAKNGFELHRVIDWKEVR